MAQSYPPLDQRPIPNTICLFDVDYTLTLPRQVLYNTSPSLSPSSNRSPIPQLTTLSQPQLVTEEITNVLQALRQKVAIGFVSGSDLIKQQEQLSPAGAPVTSLFDFCFSENGLTAYKSGKPLASQTFINWLGEDKYKALIRFVLHYVADIDLPIKRGTFVEFRNGMVNVSPIGRNASTEERNEFEKYDKVHKVREAFVKALQAQFPDLGLT